MMATMVTWLIEVLTMMMVMVGMRMEMMSNGDVCDDDDGGGDNADGVPGVPLVLHYGTCWDGDGRW